MARKPKTNPRARLQFWVQSLALLLIGAASALGFAPWNLWWATILALGLWALLLWRAPSWKTALACGWFFGLGHFLLGQHWIAQAFHYQANMPAALGWVAVLLLSMLMALYPAVTAVGAWALRRNSLARILWLALFWMITEWLRGYLLSGFAWNPLGATQLEALGIAQTAAIFGALGLSGLTILVGASWPLLADQRARLPVVIFLAVIMVAAWGGTLVRAPEEGKVEIAIVQPNIGQDEKWSADGEVRNVQRYLALSQQRKSKAPRILLWSEAAVQFPLDEDPQLRKALVSVLQKDDLLLTGGVKAERNEAGEAVGARNSVFVLDHEGRILARYDKNRLVPFGEYVPLRAVMEMIGVTRLVPGALDFWPGPGPETIALPHFPPVSVRICYEIIYAQDTIARPRRAQWILNSSNDAWFSDVGADMHLAQARLRAIEHRLPVARATPTGISAVIDARGHVIAALGRGRTGVIETRLPPPGPAGPYARLGDLSAFIFMLGLIVAAIYVMKRY